MTDNLDHEVMTGLELMDATRTVVRTLGRDKELDVDFAGDEACTNGKSVRLPSVPNDTPVTKRQSMVIGGFANHETLHKLLTDFKGAGERMQELASEGRNATAALANAIEDVRIENGGKVMYPGMPDAINQTARHVTRKFIDDVYPKDPTVVEDFQKIGPVAVTWAGRKRLGYDDPSYDEALSLLPEDVRERVERIADATMGLDHGVRRMGADSINRTKDDEAEQDADRAGHGAIRPEEQEPISSELDGAMEEMIGQINETSGTDHFHVMSPGHDRIAFDDFVEPQFEQHYRQEYSKQMSHLGAVVGTVRRKLERALIAEDYVGWQGGMRRGRLDASRNASKIVQFKPTVYRQRVVEDGVNTAITLLCDLSYSMTGRKAHALRQSVIALSEALEPTRVEYEIIGHRTGMDSATEQVIRDWQEKHGTHWTNAPYDRIENVEMPLFKSFDETLRKARPRIGAMVGQIDNANADACAIRYATSRLLARREPRKVLIVLSDGSPAWNQCRESRTMEEWTVEQIRRTEQLGVEVVGIGISDSSVKDLYDKHVVINDAGDLATGVMDQLAAVLTGKSLRVSA